MKKISEYTIEAPPDNVRNAKRLGRPIEPVHCWRSLEGAVLRVFGGKTPLMSNARLDSDFVQALRANGRDVVVSVFDVG